METNRGARHLERSSRRDVVVPGDDAALNLEVAAEQNEKAGSHCVHEGWTPFHGIFFAHVDAVERLRRHAFEPIGKPQCCRYGRRELALELRGTAEFEYRRLMIVRHVFRP